MRLRPVRLALALALLLSSTAPGGLAAQENATLIADKLEIAGDNRLVADGLLQSERLVGRREHRAIFRRDLGNISGRDPRAAARHVAATVVDLAWPALEAETQVGALADDPHLRGGVEAPAPDVAHGFPHHLGEVRGAR